jgi:hypothetical protein
MPNTVEEVEPTPVRARRRGLRPATVAAALLSAGLAYRLLMILLRVPNTDGDEAVMGLMARHIAEGRHFPAYFYGDDYMGSLEAYLAAPFVGLFGPSVLALRLPALLICYAVFGWSMYRLTARLYTRWFAVAVVGLLALGSDHTISMQLRASGGYPELDAVGALLVLLAVTLAAGGPGGPGWRRLGTFGLWGLAAGFVLWDDWLPLPYVAAAGVMLLACCRRELLGRAGAAVLAGVLIGAAPLLWHSMHAPPGHNIFAQLSAISRAGGGASPVDHFYGAVLVGTPFSNGLCYPDGCAAWQMAWGPVYLILLAVAGWLAVSALRAADGERAADRERAHAGRAAGAGRATDAGRPNADGADEQRARQAGRLALVVAAGLAIALYLRSGTSGTDATSNARYLHALPISTAAVLWPLWAVAGRFRSGRRAAGEPDRPTTDPPEVAATDPPAGPGNRAAGGGRIAAAALVALLVTAVVATVGAVLNVPAAAASDHEIRRLIPALDRLGVTRAYGDYKTCNRLSYLTGERIVCAVLRDDLRRGRDRYQPFRQAVDGEPRPFYVVRLDTPMSSAFEDRLRRSGVPAGAVADVAGYRIYHPGRRLDVPAS